MMRRAAAVTGGVGAGGAGGVGGVAGGRVYTPQNANGGTDVGSSLALRATATASPASSPPSPSQFTVVRSLGLISLGACLVLLGQLIHVVMVPRESTEELIARAQQQQEQELQQQQDYNVDAIPASAMAAMDAAIQESIARQSRATVASSSSSSLSSTFDFTPSTDQQPNPVPRTKAKPRAAAIRQARLGDAVAGDDNVNAVAATTPLTTSSVVDDTADTTATTPSARTAHETDGTSSVLARVVDNRVHAAAAAAAVAVVATAATSDTTRNSHDHGPGDAVDKNDIDATENRDANCIFRDSPLYRKVYVYPNPHDQGWEGDILSSHASNISTWPWIALDQQARNASTAHYNIWSANVQYATELLVRELFVHKDSCLRTYNPAEATLFYVPYLPSTEHHVAHDRQTDYTFSPYGKAIADILDQHDYTGWERTFGLTSKYWQRRNGSDHILVFSEPMHGLFHPRNRRGNYHFVHSQKQLAPPIVISVELSTSFVEMYPKCAAKNILVPYPNTHGDWFNDVIADEAAATWQRATNETTLSAATPTGINVTLAPFVMDDAVKDGSQRQQQRPVVQFYAAGNHGTCTTLRRSLEVDYKRCSTSYVALEKLLQVRNNNVGMRLATYCPAPGGDSPSAKRMFDALIAGCIPVILSHDFVWPFTKEFDPSLSLDPAKFSIRLDASDYTTARLNHSTCRPVSSEGDDSRPSLEAFLEAIPRSELEQLQRGVQQAGKLFSWYSESKTLPQNPLRDGVLPNGGTAHFVVQALAERAEGVRWPACQAELQLPRGKDPSQFKC